MFDVNTDTLAHKLLRTSFDSLDAERTAAHKAAFVVHDDDLSANKYVFSDGSFLTNRNGDMRAVDPLSPRSLIDYADWAGVSSAMEVTAITSLLNMLEPGSRLVH